MCCPKTKVVVVMGPTASGKTKIAVRLAKAINGEIISADSRQVFRGMDIGSGKDLEEYHDIKYHLIDILDAGADFSVSCFQSEALKALQRISSRGNVPIICGGTGHYIKALLEDYQFDSKSTDPDFTNHLENQDRSELYRKIMDLGMWDQHHWESDSKRRMARYIEKSTNTQSNRILRPKFKNDFSARLYFTSIDRLDLLARINIRLEHRLKGGLIDEVNKLLLNGVSFDRLERYGLEYKWVAYYLKNLLDIDGLTQKLRTEIGRYAKRQMTFIRYLRKNGYQIQAIENWEDFLTDVNNWLNQKNSA